jgi:putative heme-binding domain-containing protein
MTLEAIEDTAPTAPPKNAPELTGGSWGLGARLFHDSRSMCGKCHAIHGDGPKIGPDLGRLTARDYASVLKDIQIPSRMINPDYTTHLVQTVDGRALTGVISSSGDQLLIADSRGDTVRIDRGLVESIKALPQSVMPTGLLDKLSQSEQRDLLTYLLTPPPHMPLAGKLEAPPTRTQAEVALALQDSQAVATPLKQLKLVLVDGVKDHGPGEHDYPAWQQAWLELLRSAEAVEISTARNFPSQDQLSSADVLVFFQKGAFSVQRASSLDKFLQRGGGAVFIHWAVNGDDRAVEFAQRIGLASMGTSIKYRHGPLTLDLHNRQHPILRNFDRLQLYDESYWKLSGDTGQVTLLASSREDDQDWPQMWVRDHQPGRVFVSIPGHYSWTFDDPLFRILLLRGIAWTADQPIDRFNPLVTPGARIQQ